MIFSGFVLKDTIKKRPVAKQSFNVRTLIAVASPDTGAVHRRHDLDGSDYTFGRTNCAECVDDARLSKAHFRLTAISKQRDYTITDLETTNGTFLDGRRISEPTKLTSGAVISAGDTSWVVDESPEPQTLPAAASTTGDVVRSVVGISRHATQLRRCIQTVAADEESVLLLGETGVGKEVAAEAIHQLSSRDGPWVAVNCASIPRNLADSILFGHAKGAFTGADEARIGLFEKADGGTLFLDEIGELPTAVQAKLLRVLETGVVQEVCGEARAVDVRVISATHKPVEDTDQFRDDLNARLSDWVLTIPPLRERRADILPLFTHFAEGQSDGAPVTFTSEFAEALLLYRWPQNVRELAKLAKRLVRLYGADEELDLLALPADMSDPIFGRGEASFAPPPLIEPDAQISAEAPTRSQMVTLVEGARGNIKAIARENDWHRMQVYRWIKRYAINPADYR